MERNSKGQFQKGNGIKDLTGMRFGRLTVLRKSDRLAGRKSYWVCECSCGNKKEIRSDSLTRKDKPTLSCGCIRDEQAVINIEKNHKHKDSYTHLHFLWSRMKQRCYNPNVTRYEDYGGRGIVVCEEWLDYEVFRKWAYKSGYVEGLSIERIDVNGNYEPKNCTWITKEEQANNRRTTVWVEYNGKRQNVKQWADELGIAYGTLITRYRRGKRPPELFDPVKKDNTEVTC